MKFRFTMDATITFEVEAEVFDYIGGGKGADIEAIKPVLVEGAPIEEWYVACLSEPNSGQNIVIEEAQIEADDILGREDR